jgi:hypothetical protein
MLTALFIAATLIGAGLAVVRIGRVNRAQS